MKPFYKTLLFILLTWCGQVCAEPTGQQLLEACEKALLNGDKGIHASICEWYVTPCDCNTNQSTEIPRVCIPDDVSSRKLGDIVIKALRSDPGLKKLDAGQAAAVILSRDYPCRD